ncbi:MAG TPA: hypothetical protein PKE69_04070 [Pyrinomonadaceae bacterium]|nr:hypothetical protein [Pyrinomonadaceae bacterium]
MKFKSILSLLLLICAVFGCKMFSGLMKQSGTILIIEVEGDKLTQENAMEQTVSVLQKRLYAFGANSDVAKISENRIEVKIYGVENPERIKKLLISQSRLEMCKVITAPNPAPVQTFPTKEAAIQSLGKEIPANRKILKYNPVEERAEQWIIIETPSIVNGSHLRDASAVSRTGNENDYQISFLLNPEGAQTFGEWTAKNINNYIAVILNDEIKSVAFIKSQITDAGEISGKFTKQTAEDLALVLRSGYLDAKLTFIEEKTFGK